MVEKIECLGAQLQTRFALERDVLQEPEIDVLIAGTRQNVAARIAEATEWLNSKRCGVEPATRGLRGRQPEAA